MFKVGATPHGRVGTIERLIEFGLVRAVAQDLVEKFSLGDIERQLRALPYRRARNPATCLQSAIRNAWAMPAEMVRAKMSSSVGNGAPVSEYWARVDALADDVAAGLAGREDGALLELHARETARRIFPNQIGNDGRDMDGMERAVRAVTAFELGLLDELRACTGTYGPERRRFGPAPVRMAPAVSGRDDTPGRTPVASRQEAML